MPNRLQRLLLEFLEYRDPTDVVSLFDKLQQKTLVFDPTNRNETLPLPKKTSITTEEETNTILLEEEQPAKDSKSLSIHSDMTFITERDNLTPSENPFGSYR